MCVVQFEERKFLEAARKTIQQAVANAGAKLDNEQMMAFAQGAGMKQDGNEDEEQDKDKDKK